MNSPHWSWHERSSVSCHPFRNAKCCRILEASSFRLVHPSRVTFEGGWAAEDSNTLNWAGGMECKLRWPLSMRESVPDTAVSLSKGSGGSMGAGQRPSNVLAVLQRSFAHDSTAVNSTIWMVEGAEPGLLRNSRTAPLRLYRRWMVISLLLPTWAGD